MAAIKDEKEDSKTGKMLALFDIMIHGHPLTKEQIATRFDVNARTANRYLAAIRQYLEEAEKEDGPRRELRYSREDRTYRIAEVENRFISKSELFAICKILLGGRTYSRKDLESLMNRLLQSAVLPEEQEEIKEFVKRELFDYLDPSHGKPDMDQLWEVAQAIKKHHVITFDYTKIGSAQGTPHRALPLGVVFSEYYFYVIALPFGDDHKPDPTVDTRTYRLDRMSDVEETKIKWDVPYNKRFREGVFKNQTQYMFSGSIQHVAFLYTGRSIEAVMDRIPTARKVLQDDGSWLITAELKGEGILMWLLSQGSSVNVLAPTTLRERWLTEARKICEQPAADLKKLKRGH